MMVNIIIGGVGWDKQHWSGSEFFGALGGGVV